MKWHLSLLSLSCFLLPAYAHKKYNFNQNWRSIGDKVFSEFEGIRHAGEFYLNDKWIGRTARIDNDWAYREIETITPYQWNDRNFYANYGGINKNVFFASHRQNVSDPSAVFEPEYHWGYVHAQDIDIADKSATVTAEAEVQNEYKTPKTFSFRVEIDNLEGKRIALI
ncbi:hypothetical protein AN1108.2 [Aspergillus nidulans FGSC A4]|uniref:Beta-galactosidase n=1 Tax=Emericella nidulans (strain FGSC A4 / ATCC 38163 / CBS 112.46 / NRRL 194 / M139) TaxID=227321 RepID=Q5BEC2_EMENI|nr:hypothetical protein [Aspergillus nidulans FGSC A4]EAA66226.1 hypothetical protein AN1108.2 [Aspergillus nidulans FGSC A4]CBF88124.1 TPA: hypothetical protein ANIA_01108 [Aspergillus nidulans FGSC A4]|eukprot:XP_658712.1 hypothetical protein AN1108.2 [Aspergillus nidulans FGSC A4]